MKLLLVEDDLTMSRNIQAALRDLHYDVEVVYDGQLAERMLRRQNYDCIVLDINLPNKNGYEICKAFREYDQHTPVLLLTAFDELEDKVQGYDSGADDYLTKPFFMKELQMRIQALVKRSQQRQGAGSDQTLVIADLVIDQRQKTVRRQGKEIALTPREYKILLKLILAQGEVISKQELLREIWGVYAEVSTNTVEVYINFLRNKLDRPFDTQLIRTRVGYGYYFEA